MRQLVEIPFGTNSIDRFLPLFGKDRIEQAAKLAAEMRKRLQGRTVWNVNSTGVGGGVAEMLRSVLSYIRGLGIDVRWLVIGDVRASAEWKFA
jgi:trehalose synthase